MALPARSMGLAGACAQSLLPALWCHLDAPGVHAGDEAMQEADIATKVEHGATRRPFASDVSAHFLNVYYVGLAEVVDHHLPDVAVGGRHRLQGDPVVGEVRQASAHAWVDGQDPFHLAAFFSQAKIAWSATAWILRPLARQ